MDVGFRPFDMLNNAKGKKIIIIMKDKTLLAGTLVSFDMSVNMVIQVGKKEVFLKGDNILTIEHG